MKITILALLFVLLAGSATAKGTDSSPLRWLPQQVSAPDTVKNQTLQKMLSEFMKSPDITELPHDSWTLTVHRYLGYAILAASTTQIILGFRTWNARTAGREPDTKTAHKFIGYSTAGLSTAQSLLGGANFWKLRHKESGKTKRIIHLGLSALATTGFVVAALSAREAWQDIEDGTAASEGKNFKDLYSNHRTAGILSGVSVLLTIAIIEW